jgi:hypothetical protein
VSSESPHRPRHRLEIATLAWGGFLNSDRVEDIIVHDIAGNALIVTLRAEVGAVSVEVAPVGRPTLATRETIRISYSDCNFGGHRAWWTCPGCGSRRSALFEHQYRWRCRCCLRMPYRSQRLSRAERMAEKITALRAQLGRFPHDIGVPPRPKGMRCARYLKTLCELRDTRLMWAKLQRERLAREIARLTQSRTR